ncbi:MAG: hypothetical protein P4L75_03130 [Clostridia bacterium]|nr:hypothetical protein [Clostridia bacterium]MDR3645667.1 hypothetical protein [Clostridia bacterium]
MQISEKIGAVSDEIREKFHPQMIILFNFKRNLSGEAGSFKLCLVMDSSDTKEAERRVYLEVESEIPYDVLIYTPVEWEKLSAEEHSFAHRIKEKGTVLYALAS